MMLYMAECVQLPSQRAQHERERQQRLKLKRKQRLRLEQEERLEKLALTKRKLQPSAAPKRKVEAAGAPKLKRLVKKSALEQVPPVGGISSDELEDLPLAKRVRRDAAGLSRQAQPYSCV